MGERLGIRVALRGIETAINQLRGQFQLSAVRTDTHAKNLAWAAVVSLSAIDLCRIERSRLGHQRRFGDIRAWSGQPQTADLSKNSPAMPLSAKNGRTW